MRSHACEDRFGVGAQVPVNLTTRREQAYPLPDQRRQRLTALADDGEHEQPGNHAAVAVGELAKIMVGAHFTAVRGVDLAHLLLDERMSGLTQYRRATIAAHDVERVPGEARVMHDARPGLLLEKGLRQEPDQVVPLDELSALIEEKAAVVVPIPGETQVRAGATYYIGGGGAVFLQHRVRDAVRKGAVGFVVHLDELERQVRFERIDNEPRPAVA